MSLIGYLCLILVATPVLYIWQRSVGGVVLVAAFLIPVALYLWSGISLQTYAWSWALPLAAGLIVTMPLSRRCYVGLSRKLNEWSTFTMEVEDNQGHLHYMKRIDQGNYINGGPGSGKSASCNRAYALHAVTFEMSVLVHDLKKYELSNMLYPMFRDADVPYHVFALFDPERSVRVNPIAPEYIPDEASLRARVESFILAAQGRESSDSTSDFFNKASESLLEALIWYLRTNKPECCNLPFVLAILNNPENLHLQDGRRVKPFGKLELLLKCDPQIYSMASAFFQGMGNADTTSNILQTVILALNTINTDAGFYLLSENDVDLHINKSGNRIGLALVNDPKNTQAYRPILAMVGDAAMTMMQGGGSDPAMVLMDEAAEFPSTRMQNYTSFFRSLGVCMVYTTQDMSQIQRTQGGKEYNQRTMLSNFAHQFFGRTSSEQTAKYYEGMMPQVNKTEKSYNSSSSGGSSTSRRTVKKPLYEKAEFFALRQGEFVYFNGGKVKRFRFKLIKSKEELPPKIRAIDNAEMHRVATGILRDAADFMNSFTIQQ